MTIMWKHLVHRNIVLIEISFSLFLLEMYQYMSYLLKEVILENTPDFLKDHL